MAPTDTKTAHTFSRHVAPFAPLVLALLLSRAVLPSGEEPPETTGAVAAAKCDDEVDNFQACHERFPTGCTQAGTYDAYVKLLKNQLIASSTTEPAAIRSLQHCEARGTSVPPARTKARHID